MLLDPRFTHLPAVLHPASVTQGDSYIDITPSKYCRWKAWIGRMVAAGLLLPGLVIIGLLVLLVRLTSPGPAIYRQRRVGQNGRTFWLYKIRTMVQGAEQWTGPIWSAPDDPRITRVGRVLRKLHLDEFPQLLNVLRGDMTLIGPRPERPEFVELLQRQVPGYLNRLAIRPGISGLAQINLPPDTDLDSVRQKLALDVEYIVTANLLLDFRLICCTAVRLLGVPGDIAMRLFRLARNPEMVRTKHFMTRVRQCQKDQSIRQLLELPEADGSSQVSFGAVSSES